MRFRNSRGFTLIEVVMVLAIGALLTAGVIGSQGGIRQHTSVNSTMEQVKNKLKQVQNEATHSVGTRPNGGNSVGVIFGKIAEFDPATPSQVRISTLIAADEDADSTPLKKCDTEIYTIQNGVLFRANAPAGQQKRAIIFTGNPEHTYVAPAGYVEAGTSSLGCGSAAQQFNQQCPQGTHGTFPSCDPDVVTLNPCPTPTISNPSSARTVTSPTLSFTASGGVNGATMTFSTDKGQTASASVGGSGSATASLTFPARGVYQVSASQAAPNCTQSPASATVSITYAPLFGPPVIESPAEGAILTNAPVTVQVKGEPGNLLSIDAGATYKTADAQGRAIFSFTPTNGTNVIEAIQKDSLNPSNPITTAYRSFTFSQPPTRPPSSRPDTYNRLCYIGAYSVFGLTSSLCPDGSQGTVYGLPQNAGNNPSWNFPCRLNNTTNYVYSYNYGFSYCPSGTTIAQAEIVKPSVVARSGSSLLALIVGEVQAAGSTASNPPACPSAGGTACNILTASNYTPENVLFTSADTDIEFWQDTIGPAFIHVDATSNSITTRYGF